jgi:hypothetical protein
MVNGNWSLVDVANALVSYVSLLITEHSNSDIYLFCRATENF